MTEMPRRKALGKGLSELFDTEILDYSSKSELEEEILNTSTKEEIIEINLDELRSNPYQPRITFDEDALNELTESIKEHGVFQPIIVKKSSIKGYEIIAGERRVKASRLAGKTTIPAIVREFNDTQMMEIALLENLQRENLNPIEEAQAYVNIMKEKQVTQEEFSKTVGKSQSYITNMVGLLRLPEEVKKLVISKELSMSHARILSKIDNTNLVKELANKVINEGLSVRELEAIAQNGSIEKVQKRAKKVNETSQEYQYVEELLRNKLDTKVKVYSNKLEVKFNNVEDLNRILDILNIGK